MTRKTDNTPVTHTVLLPDGSSETHTETAAEHAECLARLHAPHDDDAGLTGGPSPESA